jgi:hypothetical protein
MLGTTSAAGAPSIALCQPGDTLLSGGFILPLGGNNLEVRISQPLPSDTAWIAQANSGTAITAVAFCFDNTPPSPP